MPPRAVKQSPILDGVEEQMRRIGTGSFLGSDPRRLIEILQADRDTVSGLGLDHEAIARRLEEIGAAAKKALGEPVLVEDRYEIQAVEVRGKIPCPWRHPRGLFPKSHIQLADRITGEALVWTDLSVHLIREHGFYQGKGSPYRMEPERLKRILDL